jgi:hypothetical protein
MKSMEEILPVANITRRVSLCTSYLIAVAAYNSALICAFESLYWSAGRRNKIIAYGARKLKSSGES